MAESVKRRLIPAACALSLLVYLPCAMRSQQTQAPIAQMPSLQLPAAQAPTGPVASLGPRLTLADAERLAIEHNPNISVARLIALAQAQVTREVRSAELPTAQGDLTAVGAHENSRITAGLLNNPSVYDRAAGGLTVSQLITDFGRTHNLVRSAQSNAKVQLENERATELDITLTVDQAFYQAKTAFGSRSELCGCATLSSQIAFVGRPE